MAGRKYLRLVFMQNRNNCRKSPNKTNNLIHFPFAVLTLNVQVICNVMLGASKDCDH